MDIDSPAVDIQIAPPSRRSVSRVTTAQDTRSAHVDRFVAAIERDFLADAEMIRAAVADRSSFNVFDQVTMMKADVFVARTDRWIVEELVRARAESIEVQERPTPIGFATAEDTLLYKPVWYRLGGEQTGYRIRSRLLRA